MVLRGRYGVTQKRPKGCVSPSPRPYSSASRPLRNCRRSGAKPAAEAGVATGEAVAVGIVVARDGAPDEFVPGVQDGAGSPSAVAGALSRDRGQAEGRPPCGADVVGEGGQSFAPRHDACRQPDARRALGRQLAVRPVAALQDETASVALDGPNRALPCQRLTALPFVNLSGETPAGRHWRQPRVVEIARRRALRVHPLSRLEIDE